MSLIATTNPELTTLDELAALPIGSAVVWHWDEVDEGLVDQKKPSGWSQGSPKAQSDWMNDRTVTCHLIYDPTAWAGKN